MIKANGSLTLKADAEYGRFQIKCSAGETIPVDASGAPVGQVVFTFYKLTTEGTMTAFTAAKVFYELLDADGDSLYDDSLNSVARLDITADLKSYKGKVSSVGVIVYDDSNVMLANSSFGISMPGADAEVYLLSLTEGHYLVDSDGNVDAKLAGFLYKKTGGSTVGVAGARVDIGYVNGISANTTTKSDGSWTDDDYFKGDKYNDPDICNSSPAIFARYELNGVVEATQYVSLGQQGPPGDDGQDGTSYEIVLNTGATVPCTAYAELKSDKLIVRLLKDGTAVNFEMFYIELQDEHETVINRYTGTHSNESYDLSSLFMSAIEGGKAPYYIYTKAYVGGKVVTEKTFSVTYETPFPFVRRETEWSAGLTFRNGDILILGADFVYRWSYPISGNSTVDPKTDIANNKETTHWNAYNYYDMVATRILLAEYALIKNLGVESVEMKDANGNILFQAKDGNVTCKTGTFNNIDVQSGTIGGFTITANMLRYMIGNLSTSFELSQLGWDGYEYSAKQNNTQEQHSIIGSTTVNGARTNCSLKQSGDIGAGTNIGLASVIQGAAHNFAVWGVGNIVTDGMVCGFNMLNVDPTVATVASAMTKLDISQATYFTISSRPSNGNGRVALPTYSELLAALGVLSSSRLLCMEITVTNTSSGDGVLYGRNTSISGMNTSEYPELHNGNSNSAGSITISPGDVIKILLFGTTGVYYANIISIKD